MSRSRSNRYKCRRPKITHVVKSVSQIRWNSEDYDVQNARYEKLVCLTSSSVQTCNPKSQRPNSETRRNPISGTCASTGTRKSMKRETVGVQSHGKSENNLRSLLLKRSHNAVAMSLCKKHNVRYSDHGLHGGGDGQTLVLDVYMRSLGYRSREAGFSRASSFVSPLLLRCASSAVLLKRCGVRE